MLQIFGKYWRKSWLSLPLERKVCVQSHVVTYFAIYIYLQPVQLVVASVRQMTSPTLTMKPKVVKKTFTLILIQIRTVSVVILNMKITPSPNQVELCRGRGGQKLLTQITYRVSSGWFEIFLLLSTITSLQDVMYR